MDAAAGAGPAVSVAIAAEEVAGIAGYVNLKKYMSYEDSWVSCGDRTLRIANFRNVLFR